MMKAALRFYRDSSHTEEPKKITLGEWNSAQKSRVSVRTRRPRPKKVDLSPAEQALLRLVKNGQVGALIAHHAPPVGMQNPPA